MVVLDGLPQIPAELLARAARWDELKRWERRELGQALRRLGLSYNEIARVIPVHDGTLSAWCRDVELSDEQRARLAAKRPRLAVRQAVGEHLRKVARDRHEATRTAARSQVTVLATEPLFVAGVRRLLVRGCKDQGDLLLEFGPEAGGSLSRMGAEIPSSRRVSIHRSDASPLRSTGVGTLALLVRSDTDSAR